MHRRGRSARVLGALMAAGATWLVVPAASVGALDATAPAPTPTTTPVHQPGTTTSSRLDGVSCPSATACVAVGGAGGNIGSPGVRTLAEGWAGARWSLQTLPRPPGSLFTQLAGVSCPSTTRCTAVGSNLSPFGSTMLLAERWDGERWRLQPVPLPAGPTSARFMATSCGETAACTAVGFGTSNVLGLTTPLAERWDGGRWKVEPTAGHSTGATTDYYLALGDSVPVWEGGSSYPYLIADHYRHQVPSLQVENLAVSGASTTSMREGGQYQQALQFLRQHRGHVVLVTVDIGGNDVVGCFSQSGPNRSCLERGRRTIRRNLSLMLRHLRAAAPGVPVVGMSYYDPFLGEWLAGGGLRQRALQTVPDLVTLDHELGSLYGPKHTADVQDAFGSTDTTTVVGSRWGQLPVAVDRACLWLDITCHAGAPEGFGDDPNVAGEAVIAHAFAKRIGPRLPVLARPRHR